MANVEQMNYPEQDNAANEEQGSLSVQGNVGAGPLKSPQIGSQNDMHKNSWVSLDLENSNNVFEPNVTKILPITNHSKELCV